ncbi:hypothetical protein ABZT04_23390 [Streptomyces sp. NPDC005492]|uniref:hypothetical protein n=1 Tax=Streptomyces sp. NPDC005492 TaxID=3156883 RepID=UPI0033A15414
MVAGFEVIIAAAVENATAPDQTFTERQRLQREDIDLILWRALPDTNAPHMATARRPSSAD